ncbi:MAG TPA: choice-of-anchor K domain-containing protein, partial [Gammaproteobacteria bacterium]|nr:choice-of-anchor K domain-containing protein [Gammaproteobacteria bacterium]
IPFFSLGSFTHRNFAVDDPSLTSVQLDVLLVISVDGVPRPPLTFTFTFNHEETPNFPPPPATCPYPTPPGEGCTDRVTIVASPTPTTFNVDGFDYTLSMSFLNNGNPVSEFITREGGTINSSGLVGEFTPPPIPPGTPTLTVDKSGPATMNPAEWGNFAIDVRNVGTVDAFNVTLLDRLPDGPTGGMCTTTPQVLSARVFASDGVTPVPGKGPLVQGTDYSLAYNGAACELTFNALSAPSVIGVGERLIIAYRAQLDSDFQYGTTLTNVAGATQWYNAVATNPGRTAYTRTLTDGTAGVVDHEDAHTVVVVPLLYADKAAALQVDGSSPGIVDAGDVLRYTIRIYNNGQVPITQAMLRDSVPANTTYVADSTTLNGLPVGQPDGGVWPLVAGVDAGTLSAGAIAVVTFDLRVNDGVPPGTVIANQAIVDTAELPNLLTDGDGNPATGPEPTVVVVGNLQEVRITKNVSVVGGGPAVAGATLEYVVQATNVGTLPAIDVVIRDDIAVPQPGYLTFVDQSWSLNGATTGITVVGSLLTADYSTTYGALQPGRTATLRFQAVLDPSLAIGTRVTNTGTVYWDNPVRQASASVSIDVGGIPGVGLVNGRVWHDADFDDVFDANELPLASWDVELLLNGSVAHTARTAADGIYRMSGVEPNYATTDTYELRFRRPGAVATTALLGRADSAFTNDLQRITDIVVMAGNNLQNLNLPIDPNGIVYDAISRAPIPGASVTLAADSGAALPSACFYDPNQQGQVTLADGYYKLDLNFADPACPSGGRYLLQVTPPSTRYLSGVSEIIPPMSSAATAAFVVPSCPASIDDAVPATAQHCEATASELQPAPSVAPRTSGTLYYLHLTFDGSVVPGSSQIFNNHIPLDLDLDESVTITKTTPMINVTRGQLVPYVITIANGIAVNLTDVTVVDRFPAGFRYVEGSARLDGEPREPAIFGRELAWTGLDVTPDRRHTLMLVLAVGSGVGEGEFVNRAQAMSALTGRTLSSEATATVRIVPDPALDCTDVIGKVFDDQNRNGLQDEGERGIPQVRLATARGLLATTDQFGRFHITCAITPHESRGTNFVLKLDNRTLPSGYRASTENLRVQRATRGKALEFNFGASIHRVIGLDLADPVFEPGSTQMRALWLPRLELLMTELRVAPSVLRLSYLADLEDPQLVDARLKALRVQIEDAWRATEGGPSYALAIEPEVFWRRGAPAR